MTENPKVQEFHCDKRAVTKTDFCEQCYNVYLLKGHYAHVLCVICKNVTTI